MDRDDLNAYLDGVLIGGWDRVVLTIADYDPAWPARFEHERAHAGRGQTARRRSGRRLRRRGVGTTLDGGDVPVLDVALHMAALRAGLLVARLARLLGGPAASPLVPAGVPMLHAGSLCQGQRPGQEERSGHAETHPSVHCRLSYRCV